ncbi:MAG: bile acid:sodium symporter [Elainella sp. C42_A2020_010]|nr:bile acid:sodium symporter [Elainella sp. C42_A2020_010]
MSDSTLLLCSNLAKLTLFSLMLSLGVTLRLEQILLLWQRPGLLNRSILAIVVVVPMLVALVVFSFQLPQEVEIGLLLTAIAPGTSLTFCLPKPNRAQSYAIALQATVSLLAVITVPMTIAILQEFFPPEAQISPLTVGQQLAVAQFLPLMIGMTVRYCWSDFADNLETLLGQTANVLLCILILWILAEQLDAVLQIGLLPLIVIGLLALISLWIGHFLGGRESLTRVTLATTTATHSAALALFIAILNLPHLSVSPVITVYVLVSGALTIAYLTWNVALQMP